MGTIQGPYKGSTGEQYIANVGSNGALDINVQDQISEIVDLYVSEGLDTVTILADVELYDTTINIETTGYTPLVGDNLCLKENSAFSQSGVVSVTPITGNQYTLGLDVQLDFAFTTEGGCSLRNVNMAVDGSSVPRIFEVSPRGLDAAVEWDLCRMIGSMVHAGTPDDGKFGGAAALAKGVFFRRVNGTVKNGFSAKTNGDLALRMYDVYYTDKAPAGENGTRFRRSFNGQDKNGVAIRLTNDEVPEDADTLQVIIQDDLTDLTSFHIVVQGHVVIP